MGDNHEEHRPKDSGDDSDENARRDSVTLNIDELPYMQETVHLTPVLSNLELRFLAYGGILFLIAAFACVVGLVWMVVSGVGVDQSLGSQSPVETTTEIVQLYLSVFFAPLVLLVTAALSSAIGYLLLRTAGAAKRQVIPEEDRKLLEKMLLASEDKGLQGYIQLSSLSGMTGFFTKIGLSGLPLATIALTLVFTFLAIWSATFSELAKLTLGVFLGSYVQQHAGRDQPVER